VRPPERRESRAPAGLCGRHGSSVGCACPPLGAHVARTHTATKAASRVGPARQGRVRRQVDSRTAVRRGARRGAARYGVACLGLAARFTVRVRVRISVTVQVTRVRLRLGLAEPGPGAPGVASEGAEVGHRPGASPQQHAPALTHRPSSAMHLCSGLSSGLGSMRLSRDQGRQHVMLWRSWLGGGSGCPAQCGLCAWQSYCRAFSRRCLWSIGGAGRDAGGKDGRRASTARQGE
jgi:hypothetical protein